MAKSPECRDLGWFPLKVPGAAGRQDRGWGGGLEPGKRVTSPPSPLYSSSWQLNPRLECGWCFEMQRGLDKEPGAPGLRKAPPFPPLSFLPFPHLPSLSGLVSPRGVGDEQGQVMVAQCPLAP